MKHTVTFQPSGVRGEVEPGASLMDAARLAGERLYAACGGQGVCGKCRVMLVDGDIGPASHQEQEALSPEELADGLRLACQAFPHSSATVFVPEESSGSGTVVLGADASRCFPLAPPLKNLYIELGNNPAPGPAADAERLKSALGLTYGLEGLSLTLGALRSLHGVLAEGEGRLTATVRNGSDIILLTPGYSPSVFGAAFDVGTTTIASTLCELSTGAVLAFDARTNPLVGMGEDVLSRISRAMSHEGSASEMRAALLEALNGMIRDMVRRAGAGGPDGPDGVMEAVIAGNTVMHHMLLGLPLDHLGVSPFVPAAVRAMEVPAPDAGLLINPAGRVYTPPLVAGFIGCDLTSAVAAVGMPDGGETTLVVDIGTNGELALFHRGTVLAASCATGPAFEGAQISRGMRASPGAIERVLVDPDTWEVSYRVVGEDGWSAPGVPTGARGICGSGTVDLVAQLRRAGVLDETGGLAAGASNPRLRAAEGGGFEFVVAWPEQTGTGRAITFTQSDVRAVQLAKAAVAAGIEILMHEAGVQCVDRLVVAGAFGNYLDLWNAASLGMFPGCRPEDALGAGNAAGDGATAQLLSVEKRSEAAAFAAAARYVELSTHPGFQERFLAAMALP